MTARQDLIAIAVRQHGVLSREDLRTASITRAVRRRLIERSELVAVGPNAHRLVGFPTTARQAILLACVALDSVASHRTAAALGGLTSCSLLPIHVLGSRTARNRSGSPVAISHTTTTLQADDIVRFDAIPCTSIARTLLLLAGEPVADAAWVRGVVGEAIRGGEASLPWLWWRLDRLRCRGRGVVTLLGSILH